MTHSQFHASLVIGSLAVLAGVAFLAPPVPPPSAESQATRICREHGIKSASAGYDYCLLQAERAIEWGEPQIARAYAHVAAEARAACQSYGLEPATAGHDACMDRETKARSLLVFSDEKTSSTSYIADRPRG